MANTVTGQIGSDYVNLENAATEATLQLLLKATLATTKAQKEAIAQLAEKAGLDNEQIETANKGTGLLGKTAYGAGVALGVVTSITTALGNGLQKIVGTAVALADNGGKASNVFAAFSSLPFGLGALADTFSMLQKIQEDQLEAYQKLTVTGANLSGNLNELRFSAARLNLTMDQFADLISRSGADLVKFGGGTETGLRAFIKIGAELNNGEFGRGLRGLGYTSEQINESMMKYVAMTGGRTKEELQNTRKISQETSNYLKELDRLAQITGESREELEKKAEQEMTEARFQLWLAQQDEKTRTGAMLAMQSMGSLYGQAGRDIVKATLMGVAVQGEAGQQLTALAGNTAASIQAYTLEVRRSGEVTTRARDLEAQSRSSNARELGRFAGAQSAFTDSFSAITEATRQASIDQLMHNGMTREIAEQTLGIQRNQADRSASQAAAQADRQVAMLQLGAQVMEQLLKLSEALNPVMDKLLKALPGVVEQIGNLLPGALTFLTNLVNFAWPWIKWLGLKAIEAGTALSGMVGQLKSIIGPGGTMAVLLLGAGLIFSSSLRSLAGTILSTIGGLAAKTFSRGGAGAAAAAASSTASGGAGGAAAGGVLKNLGANLAQAAGWLAKGVAIGASLYAIGWGIGKVAESFKVFNDVDWKQAGIGIAVVAGITGIVAIPGVGEAAGIGLAALGAGMVVFGGGMWVFGKGLAAIIAAGGTKDGLTNLGLGIAGLVTNMPYLQMAAAAPGVTLFGLAALSLAPGLAALAGISVNPDALTNIGTGLKGMVDENMPYFQMDAAAEGMTEFGNAAPILAAGLAALAVIDITKLPAIGSSINSFFENLPDLGGGWFEDSVGEKIEELGKGFGPLATNLDLLSKFNPNNLILIQTFFNSVVAAKLGKEGLIIFTDHTISLMRQFTQLPLKANIDQIVRLKDIAINELPTATQKINDFTTKLNALLSADVEKIKKLADAIKELKTSMTLDAGEDTSAIEAIIQRILPSGSTGSTATPGSKEAAESGPFALSADYSGNTNQILERGLEDLNNNVSRLLNISSQISENTYRTATKLSGGDAFRR